MNNTVNTWGYKTVDGTIFDIGTASCAAIVAKYSYLILFLFNNSSILELILTSNLPASLFE